MDRITTRGMSLVELMISLTISSVVILTLYTTYALFSRGYLQSRDSWYCMQSLRHAVVQIDADLKQCALLLPQDLKVAYSGNALFISGVPTTSSHQGISLHEKAAPPYYSVVRSASGRTIELDSVDIDRDYSADYWADLGIITDSGPFVISHSYSSGGTSIPLESFPHVEEGDRAVPSNLYELKDDGLYRNGQQIAEAIRAFEATVSGRNLTITLTARYHGEQKHITCTYQL